MQGGWTKAAGFLAAALLLGGAAMAQAPDCPADAVGVARPAACQETVLVFVTRAAFQGNFDGLAGAERALSGGGAPSRAARRLSRLVVYCGRAGRRPHRP